MSVIMGDADSVEDFGSDMQEDEELDSDDYEEDDELNNAGAGPSFRGLVSAGGHAAPFKIVNPPEIQSLIQEAAQHVSDLLGCEHATSISLCMHYRWNRDKIAEDLADRGPEAVFRVASVIPEPITLPPLSKSFFTCEICCGDIIQDGPGSGITTNDCGHSFCDECWQVSHQP